MKRVISSNMLGSVCELLPTLAPCEAAAARLAFDVRFGAWLDRLLDSEGTVSPFRPRDGSTVRLYVEISSHVGEVAGFIVAGEHSGLSMLSSMLSKPGGKTMGCQLLNALLATMFQTWAHVLPGASVMSVSLPSQQEQPKAGLPVLHWRGWQWVWTHADAAFSTCVGVELRELAGDSRRGVGRIPVTVVARFGSRLLEVSALRKLQTGDLILMQQLGAVPTGLSVGAMGGFTWRAPGMFEWECPRICVSQPPEVSDAPGNLGGEDGGVFSMNQEHDLRTGTLDDLQLPVSFEIDTLNMSVEELSSIGANYVVSLKMPTNQIKVRINVNGQTVGRGQLVSVGERLGVRIASMSWNADAVAADV